MAEPQTFQAYPPQNIFNLDPVVQKHLRRVYTSLTTALATATVGAFLSLQLISNHIHWPSNLASFLVLPALLFFLRLSPHSPYRPLAFHSFAFFDGCAASSLLALVAEIDPLIPPMAFLGAATVFACCTFSAILAKRRSYFFLSSFLFTGLAGLFILSLISTISHDLIPFGGLLYLGLFLFCGFVLYDTQLIIEKAHAGERDHLQHALDLLIDFMAIFKRLMVIMAKNQNRRNERERRRERYECTE